MSIKEIIKHFRAQAQSRFNPSPDGSREAYYNGRKDAYNDCADILERYAVKYPNGWHPASEFPKVGKDGDVEVIVIQDNNDVDKAIYCEIEGIGMWDLPNIKWWCYQPKED